MPDIPATSKPIQGTTITDLSGDELTVLPRNWAPSGGVNLLLTSDNPQTDTLIYDLARTIAVRDALTVVIDHQIAQGKS